MRKGKALILFGGLAVFLIGYAVWCSREYYVAPKFTWDDRIEESERMEIETMLTKQFSLKPRWGLAEALYDLTHPWQVKVIRTEVARTEYGFFAELSGPGGEATVELRRDPEFGWRLSGFGPP